MGVSANPTVSIIVVSYNTRDMTVACLNSVIAETSQTTYELIVIDNASTDGSAEAIAAISSARLMASEINLGFAAANNVAAQDARGEFLLLLNPDTVVLNEAITRLVAFARQYPNAQIWGGRTLFGNRTLNPASCFRRMTLWNQFCAATGLSALLKNNPIFNSEFYGGWQRDHVREVDVVTGCFFLVRRALWEQLGGFDRLFFMYGEETDFCLRARPLGARPIVTPDATIVHYGGASELVRADKLVKILKAKVTLMNRHWGTAKRSLGRSMFWLFPLTRIAGYWLAKHLLSKGTADRHFQEWRQVWTRRSEWIEGFDKTTGLRSGPERAP